MANRTFVSFDWAIKKILRDKENFTILEGFLSELLGFDVTIMSLLESEMNKDSELDKFDRVDILVQTTNKELMLIEVQYDDEDDYFHRMVYGISKLITEYIAEGQRYGTIKKAFSINIMYYRLGQGKDYVYEYVGNFIGRKKKDILQPTNHQKTKYGIETTADIFPKYYIIRVKSFGKVVEDPLDEWVYFLKNSEIKPDFKAKGMSRAKEVLRYENMPEKEKYAYNRYVENRRIEMGVLDTAKDMGKREHGIEVAKKGLAKNFPLDVILDLSGLTSREIQLLSEGKDIDAEDIT
ncbi:MAG: Rpn family recombination-promoting nuclease/putative transposase [Saprospiraceae bacterium]|nr:Rpn family recombination-promoting nuclease/putative transposase [Saprospiraceae bacterium]